MKKPNIEIPGYPGEKHIEDLFGKWMRAILMNAVFREPFNIIFSNMQTPWFDNKIMGKVE